MPEIKLKSRNGIPMLSSQPRPSLAWHMLGIVGMLQLAHLCPSLPSLPSQLPYHYLLAHTALHTANSATVSRTFIIFITPPELQTPLTSTLTSITVRALPTLPPAPHIISHLS